MLDKYDVPSLSVTPNQNAQLSKTSNISLRGEKNYDEMQLEQWTQSSLARQEMMSASNKSRLREQILEESKSIK